MQTNTIKDRKENIQIGSVREFFEGHAQEYNAKYSGDNKFYNYFFYERLDKATDGLELHEKSILDIGAGTGPLYDYLIASKKDTFESYTGTDISDGMLKQSNIPIPNQIPGDFLQIDFQKQFDLIFMLGVSTYISPDNMKTYIKKMKSLLKPEGTFIITFTNKHSIDIFIRNLFSPIHKLIAGKSRVMSQSFKTYYYSKKEIQKLLEDFMEEKIETLNHTIFPISRLFPRFSIFVARNLFSKTTGRLRRLLSSDLLVFTRKK